VVNQYNPSKGGKNMKIKLLGVFLLLGVILVTSRWVMGQEFKDYNVAVVQEFSVSPTTPAPDTAGSQIAEKVVFQLRRYSEKLGLFEMMIMEGTKEIPKGKKVLLIKGEVKEYTKRTVRRSFIKSVIPGGEWTSTTGFAAHYQFIDKESGKVLYETDLRTTGAFDQDTVDYAMERNAEAAAKVVAKYKGK
jgi:hypothetical protein